MSAVDFRFRGAEIRQAQTGLDWRWPLLALAVAAYGVHYFLVGRFFVNTDDAYVRANNTTLGARVAGHVAAILPATTWWCGPAT